ncbi:hypothetical protein L1887_09958 [Cichorium endivia]|nr:hypothetical protein L1887_09958 [Cichorium endivia]
MLKSRLPPSRLLKRQNKATSQWFSGLLSNGSWNRKEWLWFGNLGPPMETLLSTTFSEDPHYDLQEILGKYSSNPDLESKLKSLLPHIVSIFGANKSVKEITEELEKYQQNTYASVASLFLEVSRWTKDAIVGIKKGAPFSILLTQRYISKVASACRKMGDELYTLNGVMKIEYRIALSSSLRSDFAEGVRAVLADKDQDTVNTIVTDMLQFSHSIVVCIRGVVMDTSGAYDGNVVFSHPLSFLSHLPILALLYHKKLKNISA